MSWLTETAWNGDRTSGTVSGSTPSTLPACVVWDDNKMTGGKSPSLFLSQQGGGGGLSSLMPRCSCPPPPPGETSGFLKELSCHGPINLVCDWSLVYFKFIELTSWQLYGRTKNCNLIGPFERGKVSVTSRTPDALSPGGGG